MKAKLPLIFMLSIILTSCKSLTTVYPKSDFTNEKVIENIPGSTDDIYIKANDWMVSTFANSKSVIEFSDKESGTILGKYFIYEALSNDKFIKIDVRIKDNSSKIKIEPFEDVIVYNYKDKAVDILKSKIENIIADYESFMKSNSTEW